MSNKRPNLFVVGAMKSASTSLHNYLDLHPDIFMTQDPWKEPGYFVNELNYNKGEEWYLALFDDAKNEQYRGESSIAYTRMPNYSAAYNNIYNYSPDARIIYIMRDPIKRAISQYWWEVEYSAEGREIIDGIINNDWIMNASYYAMQIKPYIETFGTDNVYTLTTEAMAKNPQAELNKIFEWLGLRANVELRDLPVHNASKEQVNRVVGAGLITKLKGTFLWTIIKKLVQGKFRLWLTRKLSVKVERNAEKQEELIKKLRPIMQPQVKELSELLGKDFPEWKTTMGSD